MGARPHVPYVPGMGRFLGVDPVEGGCANDYAYVHGDPINESDASGAKACSNYHNHFDHVNLDVSEIASNTVNGRGEVLLDVRTIVDPTYVSHVKRSRLWSRGKDVYNKYKQGQIGYHDTDNHPYETIYGSHFNVWVLAGDSIDLQGRVDWVPDTVDRGSFAGLHWWTASTLIGGSCTA